MNKGSKIILTIAVGALAVVELIANGIIKINPGEEILSNFIPNYTSSTIDSGNDEELNNKGIKPAIDALNYENQVSKTPSPTATPKPTPYVSKLSKSEQLAEIKSIENILVPREGTSMYVYGRYIYGEEASESYLRVPKGTILGSCYGSSSSDDSTDECWSFILSPTLLAEEEAAKYELTLLDGKLNASYIVMKESTKNGDVFYIANGLNETGTPVGVITPYGSGPDKGDLEYVLVAYNETGQVLPVSPEDAKRGVEYGSYSYIGIADRATALAMGHGCNDGMWNGYGNDNSDLKAFQNQFHQILEAAKGVQKS